MTFTPRFPINGNVVFQPAGHDMALLAHGLVLRVYHQHFPDLSPMVWFMHFREVGDPLTVARGVNAAIKTTTTQPEAAARTRLSSPCPPS